MLVPCPETPRHRGGSDTLTKDDIGDFSRSGRREQKPVAIHTIDGNPTPFAMHTWHIIRIGRTDPCIGLDDFGLGKSRMQGVESVEELAHGPHRNFPTVVALDHRRPYHENMILSGYDIDRDPRVQHPYGTMQGDIRTAYQNHLTANTTQGSFGVPRLHAGTIDSPVELAFNYRMVQTDMTTERQQAFLETYKRNARIDMTFFGKEKSFLETPGKIRFECSNIVHAQRLEMLVRLPNRASSA